MLTVYPGGTVEEITKHYAVIHYEDGNASVVKIEKLPPEIKIGDRVTVTLETTVKKVERWVGNE